MKLLFKPPSRKKHLTEKSDLPYKPNSLRGGFKASLGWTSRIRGFLHGSRRRSTVDVLSAGGLPATLTHAQLEAKSCGHYLFVWRAGPSRTGIRYSASATVPYRRPFSLQRCLRHLKGLRLASIATVRASACPRLALLLSQVLLQLGRSSQKRRRPSSGQPVSYQHK